MKAAELKLALAMAQDSSVDCSGADDSALFGFGCPDFKPVSVPMLALVRCIRWQCAMFNGGWDWKQYSEDRPFYLRRVELADLSELEAKGMIADLLYRRIGGAK